MSTTDSDDGDDQDNAPGGLDPGEHGSESHLVHSQLDSLRRQASRFPSREREHLELALEQLSSALEEIQVVELELRQQNDELSGMQALLEAERRRYQELFDFAPEALIVTDPEGNIEELNQAAIVLLGWRQKGLIGKPLATYVDAASKREYRRRLADLAATNRIADWPLRLRTVTGSPIQASLTVEAVRESDQRVATLRWLIRDAGREVAERKQIEDELSFRRSLLESQSEASMQAILVVDAEGSVVSFNSRFVEMWDVPPDVIAARSDETTLVHMAKKIEDPEAFRRRVSHLYANPEEEGRDEIVLKDGRVIDRFGSPVIGPGRTSFGRVWFYRDITDERHRDQERNTLLATAQDARSASEAASGRLNKLQAITDVMLRHAGLEELLDGLLDAVRKALGTDTATILLLSQDGANLVVRAVSGEPEDVRGQVRVPLGRGIAGRIAAKRQARIIDDVPAAGPHSQAIRSRVKSMVGVPLAVGDRVIGVVHAATFTPHAFTQEDLQLLELVAERAGVAIENAGLYDSEQQARREAEETAWRMGVLQSVTAALSESVTSAQVADVMVEHAVNALGAVAGLMALATEDDTQLEIIRAHGYPEEMLQKWRRFSLDATLPLSEAVRTGRSVWLESVADRERRYPHLLSTLNLPDHALAAIPMKVEGRSLGGMVFRFERPRVFEERETAFMIALVRQASLALERARLYEAEQDARREAELAQLRLAFLAEAGTILSGSLRIPDAMQSLARLAVAFLTDLCLIDLVGEDGTIDRVAAVHADAERQGLADLLRINYVPHPDGPTPTVRVIRSGTPEFEAQMSDEFLRRTTRDAEHLRIVKELGFQSYLCVPLQSRGRVRGSLTLVSCHPERRYAAADVSLAQELARRASLAIDNGELYETAVRAGREAERAADRTAALQSVTAALAEALTPAEVAEVIVERGLAALSAVAGSIVLLSPDRTELILLRAFGYPDEVIDPWKRFPVDATVPLAEAARSGEPIFLGSAEEMEERFPEMAAKTLGGNGAWAAIPLTVEGRTVGAIGVSFSNPRAFSDEDRTFMLALARQCAQSLERARLYEAEQSARAEAEEAEDRLTFLAEASEVLSSSLDIEITLTTIARLAVPRLADWCTIDLLDDADSIRQVAVSHRDPSKEPLVRALRDAYPPEREPPHSIWKVLLSGQPELATEIGDHGLVARARDPMHVKLLRQLGIHSHMVVPLRARGRTLGAVSFVFGESPRTYEPKDLALAEDLGRRAAVAVDNARLYDLQRNIAATLQRSLLPKSLPDIPGMELAARYRAAGEGNDVGGDFYDAFEVAGGTWILAIGDVCGKGPQAAAVTGLARHTLRAVAIQEPRPSRMLSMLNEAILNELGDDRFCTVCCLRAKRGPNGVRMTICAGGHPLPLVLRADGSLETAGRPSMLLGVLPDVELTDHAIDLQVGDAIVLYTDGVVEEDRTAVERGALRLARIVQSCAGLDAESIAEAVERSVVEHGPGAPRDDVAVLVLRVTA